MDYDFPSLYESTQAWAESAKQAGWLSNSHIKKLDAIDVRDPSNLFSDTEKRPLIVAFFGGTGVGKSTLLNRLAEQEIANTGVERPTSKEVSMYLHQSIQIDRLPKDFPVDKVRTALHKNDELKDILWIDMPDIDSTESNNRNIVLEWLPHIDVLLYVVSPERYQDEKGWRLLLSQSASHAWLFIMNQWDKGDDRQIDAFAAQLSNAGFETPIILRTDCRMNQTDKSQDDFEQLKQTLASLANQNVIDQLEHRGMRLRFDQIRTVIGEFMALLSSDSKANSFDLWDAIWRKSSPTILEGMQWPIKQLAQTYSTRTQSLLSKLKKSAEIEEQKESESKTRALLWDDWAQTRFNDAIDQLIVEVGNKELPVTPFKSGMLAVRNAAEKILHGQTELSLRQALANPGNIVQRFFLKLTGICAALLPLLAISWAAFEIYEGYYISSTGLGGNYLGSNFAIHSLLLISISWLLPWFIHRKLKPSAESVAFKALNVGTETGLEQIKLKIDENLRKILDQQADYHQQGQLLLEKCELPVYSGTITDNQTLKRLLADTPSAAS